MASYSDVLKFEAEVPANTVRLIKSGEFYRAYNHSAWLFQCCIAEYRVMRKYVKSLKSDVYYIGFPEKSLFSNIGERRSSKTESQDNSWDAGDAPGSPGVCASDVRP